MSMVGCYDRGVIIIIIVHFMRAAYRLWHSTLQDLGIPPIFSISLHCLSIHSYEIHLFLLFCLSIVHWYNIIPIESEVKCKRKRENKRNGNERFPIM